MDEARHATSRLFRPSHARWGLASPAFRRRLGLELQRRQRRPSLDPLSEPWHDAISWRLQGPYRRNLEYEREPSSCENTARIGHGREPLGYCRDLECEKLVPLPTVRVSLKS